MESIEKIKKLLFEWSEFTIPEGSPRDFNPSLLEGNEILSIIGPRRSGKTFLCYQLIRTLRKTLPKANIIYINFEDERLRPLKGDALSPLLEICHELFPIDPRQRFYLFADEIQNMKHWSQWARRVTEQNPQLKLIVTGSSSKLLSREIATALRGRTLSFKVFPLSFSEYLRSKNLVVDTKTILLSSQRSIIKRHFNDYVASGGFPGVLGSSNSKELLREYYNVMFYRDLAERHGIVNLRLLEDFLALMIDQTSCLFSITGTAKKLEEFGHSLSKNTLSNFFKYAEEAFLIFEAKKYSFKVREQMRAPRKVYIIDHGLLQAVRFAFQNNLGRLLENMVFLELQRRGQTVHYHKGERECDFIVSDGGRVNSALQVTLMMHEPRTREREVAGLQEAMVQYKLKSGLILTEDDSEDITTREGLIQVRPLWHWLIENPAR